MTTISTSIAKADLDELVNRALRGKERVVLSRRGKNVAAIVPIEDLKLIEIMKKEHEADLKAVKQAIKEHKEGKTISHEQLKKKLGL